MRKSLKLVITTKFLIIIIIITTLLFIFLPLGLKNFFVEEAYRTIEISQEGYLYNQVTSINPKTVNHIIISKDSYVVKSNFKEIDSNFISQSINYLKIQKIPVQRYVYSDDIKTIYYVINISKDEILISFVLTTYVDYYIQTLYKQLVLIFTLLLLFTLLISIIMSNSISKPLILISKKIKDISNNNWDEEIPITRNDEIGHLQESLEELRKSLKTKERIQQEMFQNISHDLKTPIMIIEGYSQLVLDGFVPNEELNDTMNSIMEEAKRLENKVKSLLYINKIDQLYADKKAFEDVDLEELIYTVITPYKKQFPNINFIIDIDNNDFVNGLFDEWRVALENIVDNMTRFAKSKIVISYSFERITIYNDGEKIDETKINQIFEPYGVGNRSNFGLGLTISKKIVNTFGYEIIVQNEDVGVKFEIYKIYK